MSHTWPSATRSPDGRQDADVGDVLDRAAVRLLVADHQVVAAFALQDLAHGLAAHRGLDGVLDVADVDAEAIRLVAG